MGSLAWRRTLGLGLRSYLLWSSSSVAEAPEEGVEMLSESVDREVEILEESTSTFDLIPKEDVVGCCNSDISVDLSRLWS